MEPEGHDERARSRSRDRTDGDGGNYQENGGESREETNNGGGWGNREDAPLHSSRPEPSVDDSAPSYANLYITNLSFKTTEESLRAAFERFGQIESIQVVKDPITGNSRGFGFINFVDGADGEKALQLNDAEIDERFIRVERARRATGYAKTPGKYMGPPQVAAKFAREGPRGGGGDRYRERGYPSYSGGGGRGYGGGRGGGGGRGYDSYGGRDDYRRDGPPPRYDDRSRGPPPGDRYGGDRYGDRGGGGYSDRYGSAPAPAPRYGGGGGDRYGGGQGGYPSNSARRDGPPPRYDDRSRGPPPGDRYGGDRGGGGYDRPPASDYRRGPPDRGAADYPPSGGGYGGGRGGRY